MDAAKWTEIVLVVCMMRDNKGYYWPVEKSIAD
jgi:hypothetical protein